MELSLKNSTKTDPRSGFLTVQLDKDNVWHIKERTRKKTPKISIGDEYRILIDNFLEDVCAEPISMPAKGKKFKLWAENISDALFRRYQFD